MGDRLYAVIEELAEGLERAAAAVAVEEAVGRPFGRREVMAILTDRDAGASKQ
jgi:hypothetical protein